MATYSTDLTTLTDAESGTWTEFASPYNSGGTPGLSQENFIQGVDCYSMNTGNKTAGLQISIVFDNGTPVTFAADEVVFAWLFYFAGTNLETYTNSGWRFGIGSSISAWDWFRVGGSDYSSHKYGGWFNFAIDPTATETGVIGGGNGGTYQFFGNVPNTLNDVTKGDPVAVDAIRNGRGIISIVGSGGTFSELAEYNDYNVGGTPPGTNSRSVDTGRHVLGLFQDAGGSYLWKGLLSFGSGSSETASFSDSNETIIIDDCPHTYPSFNKVEVINSGSTVTLNNITFISTATTANGVGYFEVVDDTAVNLNACSFNDMGIFTFKSNTNVSSTNFISCGYVIQSGSLLDGCTFNSLTATSSLISDDPSNISNCSFISSGSGHALEIRETGSFSFVGNTFSGYTSGSGGNEELYNNSGGQVTMSISEGDTPEFRNGTGASTLVIAAVTVTLTGLKDGTEVRVYLSGSTTEIDGTETATDGAVNDRFWAFSAQNGTETVINIHNSGSWQWQSLDYTIPASNTSVPIAQVPDRVSQA